jgi:hydrogenase maturation protease
VAVDAADITVKTIVVGLGNPILGDDGVGWKVAEEVKSKLTSSSPLFPQPDNVRGDAIDVECLSLGGMSLMEHLIGYQNAILIDAFKPDADEPLGTLKVFKLRDLPSHSAFHVASAHDTSLQQAFELGMSMGALLPEDVTVVGIATRQIYDFHEGLSLPVANTVPLAVRTVLDLIQQSVRIQIR